MGPGRGGEGRGGEGTGGQDRRGGGEGRGGEGRGEGGRKVVPAPWEPPHAATDLNRLPDLQGWNQDGHHHGDVLLHGAVLGDQQHQGQNERNHLRVTKLKAQSREYPLVDHTLQSNRGREGKTYN